VISSSQRPLPDNIQRLQQTNIHAPGGNRIHDGSWQAAVDLRLRPRGHWDRLNVPRYRFENPEGGRDIALHSLNLGARRGGWSAPHSDRLTLGKDPVPIVEAVGWAPFPFWTCAKNLAPSGIILNVLYCAILNIFTYNTYLSSPPSPSSLSLVFSLWAGFGRNQSPFRRPVWLWYAAF
jgi:hypothetical protein